MHQLHSRLVRRQWVGDPSYTNCEGQPQRAADQDPREGEGDSVSSLVLTARAVHVGSSAEGDPAE